MKNYDEYFDEVLNLLTIEKSRHNLNNIENFYNLITKIKIQRSI